MAALTPETAAAWPSIKPRRRGLVQGQENKRAPGAERLVWSRAACPAGWLKSIVALLVSSSPVPAWEVALAKMFQKDGLAAKVRRCAGCERGAPRAA